MHVFDCFVCLPLTFLGQGHVTESSLFLAQVKIISISQFFADISSTTNRSMCALQSKLLFQSSDEPKITKYDRLMTFYKVRISRKKLTESFTTAF